MASMMDQWEKRISRCCWKILDKMKIGTWGQHSPCGAVNAAVGPEVMMKRVVILLRAIVACQVSIERYMKCGLASAETAVDDSVLPRAPKDRHGSSSSTQTTGFGVYRGIVSGKASILAYLLLFFLF